MRDIANDWIENLGPTPSKVDDRFQTPEEARAARTRRPRRPLDAAARDRRVAARKAEKRARKAQRSRR